MRTAPDRPKISIPFLLLVNLFLAVFLVGTWDAQASVPLEGGLVCSLESPTCLCLAGSNWLPDGCYPYDDSEVAPNCFRDDHCFIPE